MVGIRETPASAQLPKAAPVARVKRLEKPDRAVLEQQVAKAYEDIYALQERSKEIKKLIESKQQNRSLISQEFVDARTRLNEFSASFRALLDEKKGVREDLDAADKARERMKADARAVKDKLPFVKVEQIDDEVKRLQYRMSHTSLSLQEEKKIILQIKDLTKSRDLVKDYNDRLAQISDDEACRAAFTEKIKALDQQLSQLKAQQDEQRKVMTEIKEREVSQTVDFPALFEERNAAVEKVKALRSEIREFKIQFRARENEYWEREQEYRKQQAVERKLKQDKREAEWKEREAARKERERENFVEPYTDEIILCDQLLSYLQKYAASLGEDASPAAAEVHKAQITAPQGVGNVIQSKKSRNDEELDGWFAGFGGKGKGKKAKGPAAHKNKDKERITHSVDALGSFAKVKLTPPSLVGDAPRSVEEVKAAKEKFVKLQQEAREARERKAAGEDVGVLEERISDAEEDVAAVHSFVEEEEVVDNEEEDDKLELHIDVAVEQELGTGQEPKEDVGVEEVAEQAVVVVDVSSDSSSATSQAAQDIVRVPDQIIDGADVTEKEPEAAKVGENGSAILNVPSVGVGAFEQQLTTEELGIEKVVDVQGVAKVPDLVLVDENARPLSLEENVAN